MKKTMIAVITVICLLCLTLSGCKKAEEKPADSPTRSSQESESGKPSEKPSEEPADTPTGTPPTEEPTPSAKTDAGILELGDYYYQDGDPYGVFLCFLGDGEVEVGAPDEETVIAEYELDGNMLTLTYEGDTEILYIIDGFTLRDDMGYSWFVRDGGIGYMGARPIIFFSEFYYLDGDGGDLGLYFFDDGEVDLDTEDDSITGYYTYDGEVITITVDGMVALELTALDVCTLISSDGETYRIYDSQYMTLELSEYYYFEGIAALGGLCFLENGDVDMTGEDGEEVSATYEENGMTVTITYDGEEAELYIRNAYMLESEDGLLFIRIP